MGFLAQDICYYSVTSFRILGLAYIGDHKNKDTTSQGFFLPGASGGTVRFFTQLLRVFHNFVSFSTFT